MDGVVSPQLFPLVRAAWLHRLGEDALAGRFLSALDFPFSPRSLPDLRDGLAWDDYSRGVNAYIVRDDALGALLFGRFARRYADLDAAYGTPAHEVAAELPRREPRRGQPAAGAPPAGFAEWPAERRIAWLIDQLDEVDARQDGSPGGVPFAGDWRVTRLIAEGEPAVDALIDCIDRDRRLTRAVHFWRDFDESRTVLAVREHALAAVSSILRVSVFTIGGTGENSPARVRRPRPPPPLASASTGVNIEPSPSTSG